MRACRALVVMAAALLLLASVATPVGADRSGPTTNDQIARLYLGVFGRPPDVSGEAYWNHQVNSGMSLERVAEFFVDSPEFRQRFGEGDETILTALYRNVLGRDPDNTGFAWWMDQIEGGREISNVVRNFAESPENVRNATAIPSRYDPAVGDGCVEPLDEYLLAYLDRMDKDITLAVHDLRTGCRSDVGGERLMPTASTFKLAVLGAVLLRAQDDGTWLSASEQSQLAGMIRFSDDADVRPIIDSMGGSDGMLRSYGPRLGLTTWQDNARWGCVSWSANDATALIEHLTVAGVGELTAESQAYATELLTTVTPSQTWGVGDGTLGVVAGSVAQKNGFAVSCGKGSRINSVGLMFDTNGMPAYSVAIYSQGWVDGEPASRQDDQPAYVVAARDHLDHIAEHIALMLDDRTPRANRS